MTNDPRVTLHRSAGSVSGGGSRAASVRNSSDTVAPKQHAIDATVTHLDSQAY